MRCDMPTRSGGPGARRHVAPHEALPVATFRRPAAARRCGSGLERRSAHPARRRAHREPGLGQRRGGDELAARVARCRVHYYYGHPRSAICQLRGPPGTAVRWPDRGRERRSGQELSGACCHWAVPLHGGGAMTAMPKGTSVWLLALAAGGLQATVIGTPRAEFHARYSLGPNGRVAIQNLYGDVRITAWDRDEVLVEATKHSSGAGHLDDAQIVVDASSGMVSIRTLYTGGRSEEHTSELQSLRHLVC